MTQSEMLPAEYRQQAERVPIQKNTRRDQPWMLHDLRLEAWAKEEKKRIVQLLDQMPKAAEQDWGLLNRFLISELER